MCFGSVVSILKKSVKKLFSPHFFSCILALCICLFTVSQSFARVYIDIDSPSFQKFPIAIQDFIQMDGDRRGDDLSSWYADALAKSLLMTGFFHNISKKAFLNDKNHMQLHDGRIDFGSWTVSGAEYLVKGGYRYTGGNLITEFRLYDVIRGELVVGKQYSGRIEEKNHVVRQFAREILFALTGDGSVFDTKIAFVMKKGAISDVYVINFDSSNLTKITDEGAMVLAPRWSPDGQYISYTSYRDGNPDLFIRSLNGAKGRKVAGFKGINLSGSWSRDGRKILLTTSKDGNADIYIMDLHTAYMERLTQHFSIDVSPAWSPDNRNIAFVSNRSGSPQIYVMDADGTNVRRLTYEGNYNTSPSWSPCGKRIAYEGLINRRFQIFSINVDGSQNVQMTFQDADHELPTWSPDGRYIAFQSGRGRSSVYIMNANGSNMRLLYGGNNSSGGPSWSPHLK